MDFIKTRKANCRNCYKCLKNCTVKSIKVENNQVVVISDSCILCGECIITCPQNAKSVNNELGNIIEYINDKDTKTFVSLAPSYISAFGGDFDKVGSGLKKLGFDFVEETSIGATLVTEAYKGLINQNKMENIITTCCPSVNLYITKYMPTLIDQMAPVASPMEAHGRLIKQRHPGARVIFIGPCLSKIHESQNEVTSQYIDGAMSFQQLTQWFEEEHIELSTLSPQSFDRESVYSRIYPIPQGILYDIKKTMSVSGLEEKAGAYDLISISGFADLKKILHEIIDGKIKNTFIEANLCTGGCINGPLMPCTANAVFKSALDIKAYALDAADNNDDSELAIPALDKAFVSQQAEEALPTDEQIREILAQIGKYTKEQELNCGSCGYSSCREKAIAVFQKKAEVYMCLPYMTDINQTLSNVTLTVTPNYIIAVDEDMVIREFNLAAQKLFKVSRPEAINKPLEMFLDSSDFYKVLTTGESIYDKKKKIEHLGITVIETIVYVSEHNIAIGIFKDVTKEEDDKVEHYNFKLESVEIAQKVIEKQMMVAQEIASLLGETTAETKVTLDKLKKLIISEGMDGNES